MDAKQRKIDSKNDELIKAVTCPVCLAIFENPVVLKCGHSLCTKCAEKIVANGTAFTCPECRVITFLGPNGISSLPRNFSSKRMAEVMSDQCSVGNSGKFCYGQQCPHNGETICPHCSEGFCNGCLTAHIEYLKIMASWISQDFNARFANVTVPLEEKQRQYTDSLKELADAEKQKVERVCSELLEHLSLAIENQKLKICQDIDHYFDECIQKARADAESYDLDLARDIVALNQRPSLLCKIEEVAEIFERVSAQEYKLISLENVASCKMTSHTSFEHPPDLAVFGVELANVLAGEFLVSCEYTPHDDEIESLTRFRKVLIEGDLVAVKDILEEVEVPVAGVVDYWQNGSPNLTEGSDHVVVLKYVLERMPSLTTTVMDNGDTLLHWAACVGLIDVVKFLVEITQISPALENAAGETPIFKAIGHKEVFKYLLDLAPDILIEDQAGTSVLDHIVSSGNVELLADTLRHLQHSLPVSRSGPRSRLALAISSGSYDMVQFLLTSCPEEFEPQRRFNILDEAIKADRLDILKLLLRIHEDVGEMVNDNGETLLHISAKRIAFGNTGIVQFLVASYPQIIWRKSHAYETALDIALRYESFLIARFLLSYEYRKHSLFHDNQD